MRQRVGLTRARARNDQQRPSVEAPESHRLGLRRIQCLKNLCTRTDATDSIQAFALFVDFLTVPHEAKIEQK